MIFPTFGLVGYVGLVPLIGNCAIYFSAFVKSLMFGGALGFHASRIQERFSQVLAERAKASFPFFLVGSWEMIFWQAWKLKISESSQDQTGNWYVNICELDIKYILTHYILSILI